MLKKNSDTVKAQTFAKYKGGLVWIESVDGKTALINIPDPPKEAERIAHLGEKTLSVPVSELIPVN